jgi:MauM/NapG family ferredoxin protein
MNSKAILQIRRLVQLISVFLLVYIIWNTRFPLSGFINPRFYFMIDPFAMFITSIAEKILLPGLTYSAILLVSTFVLGRGFCGFICPLGALQDFFEILKSRIMKSFRKKYKEPEPTRMRYLKYIIFASVVATSLFGFQFAWCFDPITIFVRTVSFNLHPFLNRIIDGGFTGLLAATGYPEPLESLYDWLRGRFLSLSVPEFAHTNVILGVMAVILLLTLARRRFWCRYVCPLGAMLALSAKRPLLKRDVHACTVNCGVCKNVCRMNAIRKDNTYLPEECVLCLDCMHFCPNEKSTFGFKDNRIAGISADAGEGRISRAQFILTAFGVLFASAGFAAARKPSPEKPFRAGTDARLRPPGALPENEFIQRCIRCGNCMKVCPTNVLTPSPIGRDPAGAWSPILDTRHGYCEYQCTLCGQVCPTEAIKSLPVEKKKKTVIGIAVFDKDVCLPYAKGENCIVCEEHCPVPEKAIKLKKTLVKGRIISQPVLDKKLCIGCAICEFKCPTSPNKGVIVIKEPAQQTTLQQNILTL